MLEACKTSNDHTMEEQVKAAAMAIKNKEGY